MRRIKKALISVSDKSNLKPLLQELQKNKIELISSGGTFKIIKELKFKCVEVSEFTGFNEILDGRVKTLHPKIHAGILNKRKNKSHLQDLKNNKFENIDLVIVNFYQFEKTLEQTKNHDKIIVKLRTHNSQTTCFAKSFFNSGDSLKFKAVVHPGVKKGYVGETI